MNTDKTSIPTISKRLKLGYSHICNKQTKGHSLQITRIDKEQS